MSESVGIWDGLLPKHETGSLDFIKSHPEYDGRGVIIGILDTGVDPGAIGLSKTSEGKPKVIDIIDCTGSGDVIMGAKQKVDDKGQIQGALGYPLTVSPEWVNPTGDYRTGWKALYDLYPKSLKTRMKAERKKEWRKQHQQSEQQVLLKQDDESGDRKALLEELKKMDKECGDQDLGAFLDCVVWHDGDTWQCVVDTSETGQLSGISPMCDYKIKHQYRSFFEEDAFNYSIKVFDGGSLLSITVDAGAHGTHVAGIAAAYHPDDPAVNGIAPGAQIVSLKIGDTRLGSMETGVGLIRALIEAVKCGCHVINMSFGEAACMDNVGAIVELANTIVGKHRVCYIGSAGNNGPAISTVGAPCGTSSSIISVGAFVTKSLMQPGYAMPCATDETNYTWSSVGPTLDGHLGVSVMAPGGAVTCVPNWTLNKKQLMNGTSMSAPNATGCVALLLSAAFACGLTPHPWAIRTSLENSAKYVESVHPLGQGHGLLQVPAAWKSLERRCRAAFAELTFEVSLNSERFERGIYLRQFEESCHKNTYSAKVTPVFPEDTPSETKIGYEQRFHVCATEGWVTVPPYVEMLHAGKALPITVDPRGLPRGAVSTAVVRGYLELADGSQSDEWSFEIPVTVVRPVALERGTQKLPLSTIGDQWDETTPSGFRLEPGERRRFFFVPPPGCTFMQATVTDNRRDGSGACGTRASGLESDARLIVCHALQTVRGMPYRDNEEESYFRVTPGSEHTMSWPVLEGVTMEFTLARYWSTLSEPDVSVCLSFKGAQPVAQSLVLTGGCGVSPELRVRAAVGNVSVNPTAKLTDWTTAIRPSGDASVAALGERDVLPDGTPLYQLVLEYPFEVTGSAKVTPRFPLLQGVLYESGFHAQFFFVYDSHKRVVAVGDAWPKEVELQGGKYSVRLQVRHSSPEALQALVDAPLCLQLERSIKAVTLVAYKTQMDAAAGKSKCGTRQIHDGGSIGYFFKEPNFDALPKGVSAGDVLHGTFTLESKKNGNSEMVHPKGFPVVYTVANTKVVTSKKETGGAGGGGKLKSSGDDAKKEQEEPKAEGDNEKDDKKAPAKKSPQEVLSEAVRDCEVKHIKTLQGTDAFDELASDLETRYPKHLPLLLVLLGHTHKVHQKARKTNPGTDSPSFAALKKAAYKVIDAVDKDTMASALGRNVDKDDTAEVELRKTVDAQKSSLIEALVTLALAVLDESEDAEDAAAAAARNNGGDDRSREVSEASVRQLKDSVEPLLRDLSSWEDLGLEKHWRLQVARHRYRGNLGLALKRVGDIMKGSTDNKEKEGVSREALLACRERLLTQLGWTHVAEHDRKKAAVCKHGAYAAF